MISLSPPVYTFPNTAILFAMPDSYFEHLLVGRGKYILSISKTCTIPYYCYNQIK